MTCQELAELVSDYVEGRMDPGTRAAFADHLGGCPACLEYVRQLELARGALGHLPPQAMPEEVKASMLAAFRDWMDR